MNRMTPAEMVVELNKVSDTLEDAIQNNRLGNLDKELALERLRHIYDAIRELDFSATTERADVLLACLGDVPVENVNSQEARQEQVEDFISTSDECAEEPFSVPAPIDREIIDTLYGSAEPGAAEVPSSQVISRLRQLIGLNDRLMLLADLFDNDAAVYEQTISVLEQADSIDDAYIYLYEHFILDDSKEGVKRLIALLESNFA